MFTKNNTKGSIQEELQKLNAELAARRAGVKYGSEEWYRIMEEFLDDLAYR